MTTDFFLQSVEKTATTESRKFLDSTHSIFLLHKNKKDNLDLHNIQKN